MKRRTFLTVVAVAGVMLTVAQPNVQARAIPKGKRPLNIAQFDAAIKSISPARAAELDAALMTASISQMQAMFAQGKLTSEELMKYYLWRIKRYDVDRLNSVTELNPDALEIARQLDAERTAGKVRGPLHGTAALLIDVIGTGDKMHNTAGALALIDAKSDRDAFVVKRLREAGVIILGKASLTEWTGFIAFNQVQGYSTLGGQVVNPYNKKADVWGSSSGSAVAAAANFATFTLGEETFGALTLPAVADGVATLKPSMGLISRDRLIPNLPTHDTIGPMTRNIIDLALVMDVLVATDPNDSITAAAASAEKGFAQKLNDNGLRGKRVGVLLAAPGDKAVDDRMIQALQKAGAQVVPLPKQPDLVPDVFNELDPINAYAFRVSVEQYLAATNASIKTMAEIVAFNAQDSKKRVKYGQEYLQMAAESKMTSDEFDRRVRALNDKMRKQIDDLMSNNKLDFIAGTHLAVPMSLYYAAPGYPAIALPAGYQANGAPIGYVLTAKLFDDAKLIRAAYTLEQIIQAWHAPNLKK